MSTRKDGIPAIAQSLHLLTGEWVGVVFEILWNIWVDVREQTLPDALVKPARYAGKTICMVAVDQPINAYWRQQPSSMMFEVNSRER
jgi:hypothetical protein